MNISETLNGKFYYNVSVDANGVIAFDQDAKEKPHSALETLSIIFQIVSQGIESLDDPYVEEMTLHTLQMMADRVTQGYLEKKYSSKHPIQRAVIRLFDKIANIFTQTTEKRLNIINSYIQNKKNF